MSSDINFVTSMMSNDINFVTFMMYNNLFVRHPCRIGVPWDVTVCRRLSRIYVFGSVGRFRVIILADSEFVFFVVDVWSSGKMATVVLCSHKLNKNIYFIQLWFNFSVYAVTGASINMLPVKYAKYGTEPYSGVLKMWNEVEDKPTGTCRIIIIVLPPGVVSIKLCPPNAWHSRWRCR